MKTFGIYSPERRLAIVKDLLKKRPSGGEDRHGMEFYEEHDYCDRYNHYRNLFRCNKKFWGYSRHQIHRLGFRSSDGVETYILQNFYNGRGGWDLSTGEKAGVSRKVNRLWDRIKDISREIKGGRVAGTYAINAGDYYSRATLGYVVATDGQHALQLGETLFAAWAGGREDFRAEYVGFPQTEVLQQKATCLGAKLERKLVEENERHAKRVAGLESEIQAAQMALLIAMDLAEDIDAA